MRVRDDAITRLTRAEVIATVTAAVLGALLPFALLVVTVVLAVMGYNTAAVLGALATALAIVPRIVQAVRGEPAVDEDREPDAE